MARATISKVRLTNNEGDFVRREGIVGVVATPGMLAEMYGDSGVEKYRPHTAAAALDGSPLVFDKNEFIGLPDGGGIDDDYAVGDWGQLSVARPGAEVNMLIVSGMTTTIGMQLESNGAGLLRELTVAGAGIYEAMVVISTSATTRTRVRKL